MQERSMDTQMKTSMNDPIDSVEDTGAGWQAVAWTSGAALAFAVLAAMASLT
jgi:hypothetical protein